jgi:sulfur-carrier protein
MSIRVRYFASLKDSLGRGDEDYVGETPVSALALWSVLNPDTPAPGNLLAAINLQYVALECLAQDGDEVAFFPPVTGG